MAEPKPRRTGTVARYVAPKPGETSGHFVVRCSAPDGTRPVFHLDPSPDTPAERDRAQETAQAITERLWRDGLGAAKTRRRSAQPNADETVSEYADRWFADRQRRGLTSVETDKGRLRNYVEPYIGALPLARVQPDDLRAVVEGLDNAVLSNRFSWSTAGKVWGVTTKMFADAAGSKVAALRVRDTNPCAGLRGPDRGERKGKQWLYPTEVSALLSCPDVPIRWRQLYALAIYLYPRPGELAALEWGDVVSEHSYVSIHHSLDIRSDLAKPTKTGVTRKTPIHPHLAPLLDALRKTTGGDGRVVQYTAPNKDRSHGFPPIESLATTLREHLTRSGVTRADLHELRSTSKRVTFYDLRATGITWLVLDGTDHLKVMQRAGHKNFTTTQRYIREAEAVGMDVGAPFPALPAELFGPPTPPRPEDQGPEQLSQKLSQLPRGPGTIGNRSTSLASPTGFEPVF